MKSSHDLALFDFNVTSAKVQVLDNRNIPCIFRIGLKGSPPRSAPTIRELSDIFGIEDEDAIVRK
jgi:hypothetical protein